VHEIGGWWRLQRQQQGRRRSGWRCRAVRDGEKEASFGDGWRVLCARLQDEVTGDASGRHERGLARGNLAGSGIRALARWTGHGTESLDAVGT
jgi:hypothetical protein